MVNELTIMLLDLKTDIIPLMKFSVILSFILLSSLEVLQAQNAYVKLGQQALLDGDFKKAAIHLEKACVIDSTNANALWMLGYSYYHSENYKRSIAVYTRFLEIKPTDCTAYYYRARAKMYLAHDAQCTPTEKEKNLLGAIFDLTRAIDIDQTDIKYFQNRGIVYQEYAMFKLNRASHTYDKNRAINSLKASITDLEKVMSENPGHADIEALLDESKQQLNSAIH